MHRAVVVQLGAVLVQMVSPLLKLEGLAKTFPNGTLALRGVNLTVHPGTVHGLLGANGAGKSTLIKILSGAQEATSGEIIWRGERVRWKRPAEPKAAGIATLYQHIPLVPTLSVLENVFLGESSGLRRTPHLKHRLQTLLQSVGYDIDPQALTGELPIGQRQMVAILQALASKAQLIIMDEPTASLAAAERAIVYRTIKHLTRVEGTAVLFVSHFLDEIVSLTDEVTVLRDGVAVLHAATADLDEAKIATAIVGRAVEAITTRQRRKAAQNPATGNVILQVEHLSSPGKLAPCSFSLRTGEVLGIAGFLGSGRSELLHAIFGADRDARGEVSMHGKPIRRSPAAAVSSGMGLVPEDRIGQGLIPDFSLWRNTELPCLESFTWNGVVMSRRRELQRARQAVDHLHIKAASVDVPVRDLSGGNAQKVSIAKWLTRATKVLLLDEPTVGVDIGAKTEILHSVRDFVSNGGGVVMVSSEFDELLAVCDRILVMRGGSIVAVRQSEDTNEQELILLAGGTAASGPPCEDSAATTTITASPEMSRILGAVPPLPCEPP